MDMLKLDINQCDEKFYVPNAFKGTHKCHRKSSYVSFSSRRTPSTILSLDLAYFFQLTIALCSAVRADTRQRLRDRGIQVRMQAGLRVSLRRCHNVLRWTTRRGRIHEYRSRHRHPLRHVQVPISRCRIHTIQLDSYTFRSRLFLPILRGASMNASSIPINEQTNSVRENAIFLLVLRTFSIKRSVQNSY